VYSSPFSSPALARSDPSFLAEKRVLFVTNNATKSRRNYKKKFDGLGIEAHVVRIFSSIRALLVHRPHSCCTRQDEVFGSAYAAAVYLSSVLNFPMDKRVYVIGMSGLEDELRSEGISFIGGTVSITSSVIILSMRASHLPVAGSCR
jgi:ribonucleotide monophosphatase NagD (HAD superfamily)